VRLLTDVTPLRENPAYRRLWLGMMLTRTGGVMTTFAITLQVYDLTRSTAAVGGIGLATLIPMLLITVPGGTFADRVDRRRLVLVTMVAQAVLSAVLFALAAFGGASLWALYALVALGSAFSAVSAPAQQTFIPRLVPRDQLSSAMALQRIVFQVVLIAGPALAGLITAWSGLRGCYLADVASFAGALWGVGRLPAMPPLRAAVSPQSSGAGENAGSGDGGRAEGPRRSGVALTLDGLAFIRRTPVLCGAFLADVNATFFALPVALFRRSTRNGSAETRRRSACSRPRSASAAWSARSSPGRCGTRRGSAASCWRAWRCGAAASRCSRSRRRCG
jgi:MFS family permease